MICNCKVDDTKTVLLTRTQPGGQKQQITISATIESGCETADETPDYIRRMYPSETQTFQTLVGLKKISKQLAVPAIEGCHQDENGGTPRKHGTGGKPDQNGNGSCLSTYVVKLDAVSTPGLKITEVRLGADIFALEIPVGGNEILVIPCDEACAPARTASVKVVDPFGSFLAQLSRIKICECGAFA